jgi:DeoR/GlpR family transcriptional regulator of sugar metabolism
MSHTLTSAKMAEIMYKILRERGEVSLEDIVWQFDVSPSTAYNVQRLLRSMCEKNYPQCEVTTRNRRTVLVWKTSEQEEQKEIKDILDAEPGQTGEQR